MQHLFSSGNSALLHEAHKNTAKYSYKGLPGYMPIIGHINGGYIIDVDFRNGNVAPADRNLEFIKQCVLQLPIGKKFDRVRIDSAGYQAEIFNYCDEQNMKFTISGRLDSSVKDSIKKITNWERLSNNEQIAEFYHTMNKAKNAFRMIVVKKNITPMFKELEETLTQYYQEMYYCIATNDNDLTPKEIVKLHRQRGEASENLVKRSGCVSNHSL